MQLTKLSLLASSLVASVAFAEDSSTTTSTFYVTKTSYLGHNHASATTDSYTETETSVSTSSTVSVLSSQTASAFDFSNSTIGYNSTGGYNSSFSGSNYSGSGSNAASSSSSGSVTVGTNGTFAKRNAVPSELTPVISTYAGFANKVGSATGISVGALALVAGFLL